MLPRPLSLLSPKQAIVFVASGIGLLITMGYAQRDLRQERQFKNQINHVAVIPPHDLPEVSQASIDFALVLYGIEVPESAEHPQLDMALEDRGLTMRATFVDKAQVSIGPAAFSSWAMLGSTLAHEIEVHCQQSFAAIWLLDSLGMGGVAMAERTAYKHEIDGKKRFGLTPIDLRQIEETVDFYYPKTEGSPSSMSEGFRRWMASHFLSAKR
jgi:hypothetical protein